MSCADAVSNVAFVNYLRKFYGSDYPTATKRLRAYQKAGHDFATYASDIAAHVARKWLNERLLDEVVLVTPD